MLGLSSFASCPIVLFIKIISKHALHFRDLNEILVNLFLNILYCVILICRTVLPVKHAVKNHYINMKTIFNALLYNISQ